ncbi:MAG TPA: DUF885 family protein [Trebonia sp.]|nr:DUF885 family protein [Trebonia sp.]
MSELTARIRAVLDLNVASSREEVGRHEYDGVVQDLSPSGISSGLARLSAARSAGPALDDPHDEAHLRAFEDLQQVTYGSLELHRRSPLRLLDELDLAVYDKDYGPAAERAAARARHVAAWPAAIDAGLASLDQLSAPVAQAMLRAVRGLAAGLPPGIDPPTRDAALVAHARLVARMERAAAEGDPSAALGAAGLSALMGTSEAATVDVPGLAEQADAERDRLLGRLRESCALIDPARDPLELARSLVRDHPDRAGVLTAARDLTAQAIEFTASRDLVPYHDGTCLVDEAPESKRWSVAMIYMNAPFEPDGPSYYYVTPPDESWPAEQAEEWLEMFSAATLPAITVHEVAPGHFSHGRALRRAPSQVRRALWSMAFAEGWAHYAEELCVEEGFLSEDPRFAIGVWLEALVRVTRLACALGVHAGGMTVADAARRFEADTHLLGPAALSEARRATFDPTYGRYTWGKLEIMRLRSRAQAAWGAGFTLQRFHRSLLELGAPPLGLIGTAVERG